jgi:hypothetical protein
MELMEHFLVEQTRIPAFSAPGIDLPFACDHFVQAMARAFFTCGCTGHDESVLFMITASVFIEMRKSFEEILGADSEACYFFNFFVLSILGQYGTSNLEEDCGYCSLPEE